MTRQRVAALTKAEGDGAIESDPKITGTVGRDGRGDRPTLVDLPGATFMDSRCVRELAIHYQLGGGSLALCESSGEVELSVAACDLEGWLEFVHTTARSRPVPRVAGSA